MPLVYISTLFSAHLDTSCINNGGAARHLHINAQQSQLNQSGSITGQEQMTI